MQVFTKADKYIVNGKYDEKELQDLLDKFIKKYVLCPDCGNPETNMVCYFVAVFLLSYCLVSHLTLARGFLLMLGRGKSVQNRIPQRASDPGVFALKHVLHMAHLLGALYLEVTNFSTARCW